MFISCLLIAIGGAGAAEEASLRAATPAPESPAAHVQGLDAEALLELRSRENLLPDRQPHVQQDVFGLGLAGGQGIDKNLSARVNVAVERVDQTSRFYIKEAYFQWQPIPIYLDTRWGQQFMSVGLLNGKDNLYASNPPYMQQLFTSTRGVDVGVEAQVLPFQGRRFLYAEAGQYAGHVLRNEDNRDGSPVTPPHFASVKSEFAGFHLFATYFEHHLAFFNPVRAWGAGGEWSAPQDWRVRPHVLCEGWTFDEYQTDGPLEDHLAFTLAADMQIWRLAGGMRWSEDRGRGIAATGATALPIARSALAHLDYLPLPWLRFRFERVIETQDFVTRDEWIARGLLTWTVR